MSDANGLFPQQAATEATLSIEEVAIRLCLAAILGFAVAGVYFLTQRKSRTEAISFISTLVLLTILLAMVSMVIGGDIARAFSLVGALSIVRFRTVVEDTRDTAFVIFAVITGMAAGARVYEVPAVGIPLIAVVAWLLAFWGGSNPDTKTPLVARNRRSPTDLSLSTLVVRVGLRPEIVMALTAVIADFSLSTRLVSVVTARQGAAIDVTFTLSLKPTVSPVDLLAAVNKVESVQNVEWTDTEK